MWQNYEFDIILSKFFIETSGHPGVDHKFLRFLGEIFFLKNQCYDQFFRNLALFLVKNANFSPGFWRKNLKNHSIGPWIHVVLPNRKPCAYDDPFPDKSLM
jgi:hypothetical protein